MRTRRHPLSGALYDVEPDGTVRVEQDGHTGWFSADGEWLRGDLHHVDPHLCLWLAGPQLPPGIAANPKDIRTITGRNVAEKEMAS